MVYKTIKTLRRIGENPYLNIVVGLILLYSGVSETLHELDELQGFRMGTHHGVILFALLHILKTVPDFFEGLEYIHKSGKEKKQVSA